MCGQLKTIRKRYVWTQIFLKTEIKFGPFSSEKIRVEGPKSSQRIICSYLSFVLLIKDCLTVRNYIVI